MKLNKIAVLLTCHNRVRLTLKCLNHLYEQDGIDTEFEIQVFLVDDGSTDGTSAEIAINFPKATLIQGNGSLYWNRGMFTAWKKAIESKQEFDAYLWLNDDTFLVQNGLLNMHNSAIETNFKSIICGSIQSPNDPTILTYGGCKLIKKKYQINFPNGQLQIADIINGNCVLVPHEVYLKVGNLDWTFRHAIGDNEYSLRAKKIQIKSFSTGQFVGVCSNKDGLPKWCRPEINFIDRIKNLYSPLGSAEPFIFFKYNLKYFGILLATKSFLTTHIRLIFPKLWLKKVN